MNTINYYTLPDELKSLPNWVSWKYVERHGKKTKLPYTPGTAAPAKANDPKTWGTYADACKDGNGLGFELGNSPYVGIDIDHCIKDGVMASEAQEIIELFNSYTEVSPSGKGVHIIIKAEYKGERHKNSKVIPGVEVYGETRYFTMTGNIYEGHDTIKEAQAELDMLTARLWPMLETIPTEKKPIAVEPVQDLPMDADSIIARIRKSQQAAKFMALFDVGNTDAYGGDDSAADMALMNMLPFWTRGDEETMRDIFSRSALARREKWVDRPDYQDRTIRRALKDWNGAYYDPEVVKRKNGIITDLHWPVTERITIGNTTKERPVKIDWRNTDYILTRLGVRVRLNTMTKKIEITGGGADGLALDNAATILRGRIHQNGLKVSRQDLFDHISAIADRNRYSPVCEYLQECRKNWDGKDHINELFSLFELDEDTQKDDEFSKLLLRRWLLSCVVLPFNTGKESADGVLILVGPQGCGKTRFLYTLVPEPTWAADGLSLDPSIKDDRITAMGFWIVELGEFGDTLRKEKLDRLKAYFTARADDLRKPYQRSSESYPRSTVFYATTNDRRFLKDDTGDRRYWTICVKGVNPGHNFPISQLWGQMMYLAFDCKESHHLTAAEIAKLGKHNEPYKNLTAEVQLLLDMLDWDAPTSTWVQKTPSALCEDFKLSQSRNRMMGKALNFLAERDSRVKAPRNHMQGRQYTVPPKLYPHFTYEDIKKP